MVLCDEFIVFFVVSDVMLVILLCDGMNLVVKEYVVCCSDFGGVLVFSEFIGVVVEFWYVYLVNLYDLEGVKDGIEEVFN